MQEVEVTLVGRGVDSIAGVDLLVLQYFYGQAVLLVLLHRPDALELGVGQQEVMGVIFQGLLFHLAEDGVE